MSKKNGYNIPGFDQLLNLNVEDDLDGEFDAGLEDELNALLNGKPVPRPRAPVRPGATRKSAPQRPNPRVVSKNFDMMDIENITSDRSADMRDDDDVNEEDLNDENLMAELKFIVGSDDETPSASNQTHTTPQAKSQPIHPVPVRRPAPLPPSMVVQVPHTPPIPEPDYHVDDKSRLSELKDGYRRAALSCKRSGNTSSALEMMKVAKQLEIMITAIENNQPVDMSNLPPPAAQDQKDSAPTRMRQNPEEHTMLQPIDMRAELPQDISREDASRLFNAPESASSVLEALNQRLDKYEETAAQAEAKGDSSKVRRLGRIIKQYETAIKAHKSAKDFDYSSLPVPPGFPDIPLEGKGVHPINKSNPLPSPATVTPATTTPPQLRPSTSGEAKSSPKVATNDKKPAPLQRRQSSIHSKQLSYLVARQKLFKEAALEAKNRGDIQQALDYLKQAKGFEPLIEATKSGLPIDATSIPTPPQLTDDFVMISKSEAEVTCDDLTKDELFRKVEMELNDQIEMCKRNKENFTKLGDVSSASKFEKFQIDSMKDLDMLRCYWKNGDKLPRYRYETRTFSIVQSNPDLGTNEAVVIVLKAIDLPGKEDLDTFVKIEFPFPTVSSDSWLDSIPSCCSDTSNTDDDRRQETPQVKKTRVVKDTINPVFHEQFKFDMDRKSRSLARIFKRHPLKVDVISKGGFLRSDTLIGAATIKLNELETKCTLHDSYPLLDGRKTVGGRIEVKIMIREPLLSKQVEEVREKWLIFE